MIALQCPNGMQFTNCVSKCPATCFNTNPQCAENEDTCTEGCQCPKGKVIQNNKCVNANQCGCKVGCAYIGVSIRINAIPNNVLKSCLNGQ